MAEDVEAETDLGAERRHAPGRPRGEDQDGGQQKAAEESGQARVLDDERPVEGGERRQVGHAGQDPELDRVEEERGRDDEVEERLDHERRRERRDTWSDARAAWPGRA